MINHFPTAEAAKQHLIDRGFKSIGTNKQIGDKWLSSDECVIAWLVIDTPRGSYLHFIERK